MGFTRAVRGPRPREARVASLCSARPKLLPAIWSNPIPLTRDMGSHPNPIPENQKSPRKVGFFNFGAGDGNRTHVVSLGS